MTVITYRPEVAGRLRVAADSLARIGRLMPERAQAACDEASAILHEAAREFTPPPKPPDRAREHARQVAEQVKPASITK